VTEAEDVTALQRLLSEYGHIMDAEDWPGLARIFTEDAVCDWTPFGLERTDGLAHLQDYFARIRHPNAHHVTNLVVDIDGDTATVHSKLLVALDDGSVATGDYLDQAVRTSDGWRIRHRVATPRPRPKRPSPER
jgi:ketosteroid isomerase-like protein